MSCHFRFVLISREFVANGLLRIFLCVPKPVLERSEGRPLW